jgi:hypothetical protein
LAQENEYREPLAAEAEARELMARVSPSAGWARGYGDSDIRASVYCYFRNSGTSLCGKKTYTAYLEESPLGKTCAACQREARRAAK